MKLFKFNLVLSTKQHIRTFGTIEDVALLASITTELQDLLVQFNKFVLDFNQHLVTYDINVIDDAKGKDISIYDNHSQEVENHIVKKYQVLDAVIDARREKINDLVNKGTSLYTSIKEDKPDFTSKILSQAEEFRRINKNFKG